ncbi:MAG: hypothetical protein M3323_12525 [Actinomycetota bacterium]|nr:hypothetical protein [Actinomycetota bacterium]
MALSETLLLAQDPSRTWWLELECGALPGNGVYADAIASLARISRDAWKPTDVEETWPIEGEPRVSFTMNGARHEIQLRRRGDWFDVALISSLNDLFAADEGRFHALSPRDETIIILQLTEAERMAFATRGLHPRLISIEDAR